MSYVDGLVFELDYANHSYLTVSLDEALTQVKAEHARVSSAATAPSIGNLPPERLTASLERLRLATSIRGVSARVYQLKYKGRTWRLHYANGLPRPPLEIRKKLASLQPGGESGADHHCDRDDDPDVPDSDRDDHVATAHHVAGRVLLGAEVLVGERWKTVLEAKDVQKVEVPTAAFRPPVGWRPLTTHPLHDPRKMPDPHPGFAISSGTPLLPPPTTSANVLSGPGPVITNPEVHIFFWGRTFADAAHSSAISELLESFNRIFDSRYQGPLANYGIHGGHVESYKIVNDNPPSYAGGGGAGAALGNFVLDRGLDDSGPLFWWKVGGKDPLYMIYIPEAVVDSGWGGFHFLAPNLVQAVLPFPFSLIAHEGMPYSVAKVPEGGMTLPLEALLLRDSCKTPPTPSWCGIISSFDLATRRASHEYVEAVTDPFPFWGWSDVSKVPVWKYGEIADICEDNPLPWGSMTRIWEAVLDTYWSNRDDACVPESRPSVNILEPRNGDKVPWQAGGATPYLGASAQDPVDGSLMSINWSVDGGPAFATGTLVTSTPLSLGPHTFSASVTDSQGLTSSAGVSIQVTALSPVASISSPLDGATFAADDTILLRGYGFDYQDGPLPDASLGWAANGASIGSGRLLIAKISNIGDASVSLTVSNSAGSSSIASHTIHITAAQGKPTVLITQPADGSSYRYSTDNVTFKADAHDAVGKALPDSAIRWIDDVDGFLGSGGTLNHTLSGGPCGILVHHIMVSVTDSSGKTGSDTITIYVGQIC